MPRYDVRTAALALDLPYPVLDVILARHGVPGVSRFERGVKRTVDDAALLTLRLALDLRDGLGMPLDRAIAIASGLGTDGTSQVGHVTLGVDMLQLRKALAARAADAIERAVPIRRGRPSASERRS